MKDGPPVASVAALIGDPTRAEMLSALMDGRALTVGELARAAGVTLPTASGHLAKLHASQLLAAERQGRHRYFRLSGPDVAEALEALMSLAQRTGAVRSRTGPRHPELRLARVCYDHLAGERGVKMFDSIKERRLVDAALRVTDEGREVFAGLGVGVAGLEHARRPLCRTCLDWSERRDHLAGALGAAILAAFVRDGWVRRGEGRVLTFTPHGRAGFDAHFA